MYQCISVVYARPEGRDAILEAGKHLVSLSRSEPGNIYYNLLQSSDDANILILIEKWESREAFLGHVANAGTSGDPVYEFGQVAQGNSAKPPEIFNCDVVV